MSEIFGAVSNQGFLPPEYGSIPSKVVQRVSEPDPTGSPLSPDYPGEGYDGWFKDWKEKRADRKSDRAAEKAESGDTGDTGDTDKDNIFQSILAQIGGGSSDTGSSTGPEYCDVDGAGSYSYRLYQDGRVAITKAPGGRGVGTYSATSGTASTITGQVGTYEKNCAGSAVSSTGATGASGTSGASSSATRGAERGAAIGAGIGAAANQLLPFFASLLGTQEITPFDEGFDDVNQTGMGTQGREEPSGSALPWILGGVGLLVVVGGVAFAMTRGGDDEDYEEE